MATRARTLKAIGTTSNLSSSRGNAGRNKAVSILRELRARGNFPESIYSRNGSQPNMDAAQRREWASRVSGQQLSSRWHVSFSRDRSLDRKTRAGGIGRRTLEGYRVVYTYS